jgi:ligand-binding SRPBCC domain-containing protein
MCRAFERGLGRISAMKVYVESVLRCPPEKVWDEVQRPAVLLEIIRPLFRFVPAEGPQFPERWSEGATVRCKGYLFGVIPLGTHTIYIERIDAAAREIQTRESEALVRRWDHLVRIRPTSDGQTLYSDEIIIEAGWATLLVWLFAHCFYRHRQRKWRRIARRLVAAAPGATTDRPRERGL